MGLVKRAACFVKLSWLQMRTVLVFALIAAYTAPYLAQGYEVRGTFHVALNAWGTFVCTMNNPRILLVCFVGYLLLVSDLPLFSAEQTYEIVRSGRRSLMAVRVLYVFMSTALYLALLFALFCLTGGCTDFRPLNWDKLHYSYARGQQVGDLFLDAPASVVLGNTPIGAFGKNLLLVFLVFSGMGMGLLLFTMLIPAKKAAFALLCAWGGLDMAVDEMGLGYRMYIASPLSYTRLEILEASAGNLYYPSVQSVYLAVFALLAVAVTACLLFPVQRPINRLNEN